MVTEPCYTKLMRLKDAISYFALSDLWSLDDDGVLAIPAKAAALVAHETRASCQVTRARDRVIVCARAS